jgi:hypothetical protein
MAGASTSGPEVGGQRVVPHHPVVLPPGQAVHAVAQREGRAARGHHPADAAGPDRLARLDRGQVPLRLGQPGAHGGVEAQPLDLDQRLAVGQVRQHHAVLDLDVVVAQQAVGAAAQHHAAVGRGGQVDVGPQLHRVDAN